MIDIHEMTDVRELDPVELAGVVGGDGFSMYSAFPVPPWLVYQTHVDPLDGPH
jgi:hypothetical protein